MREEKKGDEGPEEGWVLLRDEDEDARDEGEREAKREKKLFFFAATPAGVLSPWARGVAATIS